MSMAQAKASRQFKGSLWSCPLTLNLWELPEVTTVANAAGQVHRRSPTYLIRCPSNLGRLLHVWRRTYPVMASHIPCGSCRRLRQWRMRWDRYIVAGPTYLIRCPRNLGRLLHVWRRTYPVMASHIPCGSCRGLRQWRMRWDRYIVAGPTYLIRCPRNLGRLLHVWRRTYPVMASRIPCGSCRRLRRWRMRWDRYIVADRHTSFAALVTSDVSYTYGVARTL